MGKSKKAKRTKPLNSHEGPREKLLVTISLQTGQVTIVKKIILSGGDYLVKNNILRIVWQTVRRTE